jgi:hypothetical protein
LTLVIRVRSASACHPLVLAAADRAFATASEFSPLTLEEALTTAYFYDRMS